MTLRTKPYKQLILAFLPRDRRAPPAAAAERSPSVGRPAGDTVTTLCISTASSAVRVRGGGGGGEPIGPFSLSPRDAAAVCGATASLLKYDSSRSRDISSVRQLYLCITRILPYSIIQGAIVCGIVGDLQGPCGLCVGLTRD